MPTYQEGGYSVEIDWSNFERIAGEVQGVPDKVCELAAKGLERNIKDELASSKVTGQLRASWRADNITQSEILGGLFSVEAHRGGNVANVEWVVGSPMEYAAYLNDGTRRHIAPMDRIQEWAEFRGLPWFAVWKGILDHGTKANPYIDRALETTNRDMPLIMNEAIAEMKARIG